MIPYYTISYYTMINHALIYSKILSINGESTLTVTKKHVLDVLKSADMITIDLQYNPEGFAVYDDGAELKRINDLAHTIQDVDTAPSNTGIEEHNAIHSQVDAEPSSYNGYVDPAPQPVVIAQPPSVTTATTHTGVVCVILVTCVVLL